MAFFLFQVWVFAGRLGRIIGEIVAGDFYVIFLPSALRARPPRECVRGCLGLRDRAQPAVAPRGKSCPGRVVPTWGTEFPFPVRAKLAWECVGGCLGLRDRAQPAGAPRRTLCLSRMPISPELMGKPARA